MVGFSPTRGSAGRRKLVSTATQTPPGFLFEPVEHLRVRSLTARTGRLARTTEPSGPPLLVERMLSQRLPASCARTATGHAFARQAGRDTRCRHSLGGPSGMRGVARRRATRIARDRPDRRPYPRSNRNARPCRSRMLTFGRRPDRPALTRQPGRAPRGER